MNKVTFEKVVEQMTELYKKKNADYGDGITKNLNSYKIAFPSYLFRVKEKAERCLSLQENGEAQVKDEKLTDTLLDIANYAVILVAWLQNKSESSDAKINEIVNTVRNLK